MPKVSVIVSVYNANDYLDRCIVSILQQSMTDFELIVVDDCSTDGSALTVRNFARNDSRIKLHSHSQNRGLGAGRNTGVNASLGEYLAFIDGDDFIAPNLLEHMIHSTERGRFDIVETGCHYVDRDDNIIWTYTPTPMKIDNLADDPDSIFLFGEWGVTQKLWRKSLFQKGNPFPEGLFWEDIALLPTLAASARSLCRTDFAGYFYLQHPATITHSRSVKHILDLFRAVDYSIAYLKGNGALERYASTIPRIIKHVSEYSVHHMRSRNLSNPRRAEYLILLSQMMATEYLAGHRIAAQLDDAAFEAVIEQALRRNLPLGPEIERQFESLMSQAKDGRHAA